ncbi:acyltransferase family protein [Undibacterium sp. LX40W]|uniref:Acyltransferase family protein n=1 Tax=Undibacterium nitidum TaxID=2762298 RepID=A0A923HNY8_9BURK|nr:MULTISPECIES: acyltransferase family protein [Undibacterium]MBC3881893.1 acyltransferase family protein [Undibacterium nitidum]MBC3892110.1 acyltransferase family protein [Undibacterium sp. LX40W]
MNTSAQMSEANARFHYMDNLRALAMLTGVVFHGALAYSVLAHPFWPTADAGQSLLIDAFAWFFHLFRMPLFFVVAGFFAALLAQKSGIGGMLKNRFMRIILPLIVFWPLVYFSMSWLIRYAITDVQNLSPLLQMIKPWLDNPQAPTAPPTLVHLWFLPYVMCFCILVWVASTLEWHTYLNGLVAWFDALTPMKKACLVPLSLMPALFAVPAPFPAPESFFPQWWALLFYGTYFLIGFRLFHQARFLDQLRPYAPRLLLLSLLAYAVFFYLLQNKAATKTDFLLQMTLVLLQAYTGYWMTLVCILFGQRWLDAHHGFLRYIADASYWVYLVHLPLIFAIQIPLMDVHLHWSVKLSLSVGATLAIAFLSYHLFVRGRLLGRFLNGNSSRAIISAI